MVNIALCLFCVIGRCMVKSIVTKSSGAVGTSSGYNAPIST